MPFGYYVKSGGVCANNDGRVDLSTPRTGLWTSDTSLYYDSIKNVYGSVPDTNPVPGDFAICSDLHDKVHTATISLGGSFSDGTVILSVDNANQEVYKRGAKESTSGTTSNIVLAGGVNSLTTFFGIDIISNGFISLVDQVGVNIMLYDCLLELSGTATIDTMSTRENGGWVYAENSIFTFGGVLQDLQMGDGVIQELINCKVAGVAIITFINLTGGAGAGITLRNLDALSMASSSKLINISTSQDDTCLAKITRCKLPTGGLICNSTFFVDSLDIIGESLMIGSGGNWAQINEVKNAGSNSLETGIYRTDGAKYANTSGNYCVEMSSNINANFSLVLRHKIAEFYIDTDDYTSTINFLLHFARDGNATEYNSDEVWIDVHYNDGANDGLGSSMTTRPEILATGTAPTTESALWTGLGTNAQMSINKSVTIGASAGNIQSGMVTVWVNFAVANDTVFVDKKVVVS